MKAIKVLMMMMMAVVTVIGFHSCNDDANDIIDNGNDNTGAYLSVNIDIPNGSASLRSAEHSGFEEAGEPDEYKVTSINLYFFEAGKYVTTVSFSGSDILPTTVSGANRVLATSKKNVALERTHTYNAYAIVNGMSNGVTLAVGSTTEDDFLEGNKLANVATSVSDAIPANGFVMASRTPDGALSSSPSVSLTIDPLNSEASPENLKISVERTVGKLMLSANSPTNTYQILDDASNVVADVELTNYAIVNAMKTSFTFRHTAAVGQVNQAAPTYQYGHIITGTSDYLMDPLTHEKTVADITNYSKWTGAYINHASTIAGPASVTTAMPTTANVILGYCYENATEQTAQKNGYSTGIIFKAKVVPAAGQVLEESGGALVPMSTVPASFYHCEGKLYKDVTAVIVDYPAIPAGTTNLALKTVYDVDYLDNGVCFYKYWIVHENNFNPAGDPVMGIMEYSIVRNNVYKMKVTGINSIGSGVPPIDPEDDNETTNVYLKMEMTILPWIVRSQEDIKL